MTQKKAKAKQSKPVPKLQPLSKFEQFVSSRYTRRVYVAGALLVLLATSCLWAILGARLQNDNADQLVDSYLFENAHTAHGASFPGQHTFLFKWPLFWLQHVFGYSSSGFVALTVLVVLLTVSGLVYLIWRIERRPFMFGLLCLALASVLLVVPPVPYAGALLPTNFAMLTTRNLEYLLYIAGLVMVAGTTRIRSVRFFGGVSCLGLLFASDRLFGTLSLGGSVLALGVYATVQQRELKAVATRWLVATLAALAVTAVALSLLNASGIVHIVGQSATSPYGLVPDLRAFLLGIVYVLFALLTNIGANPASSAITLAAAPHAARTELVSLGGLAYVVNLFLLCTGVWTCIYVLRHTLKKPQVKPKKTKVRLSTRLATRVALMLIYSTIAAVVSYLITNHYYLVDSRYVAIELFAVFISAAVYLRSKTLSPKLLVLGSGVLLIAAVSGGYTTIHNDKANSRALTIQRDRTSLIAAALTGHQTEVVVGNYWRVLPVKLAAASHQTVLPLGSCTTPRTVLTSSAWQPDLHKHSFAYVLSLDSADHDFADCTLKKVTAAYGRPNASTLIAGTNDKPQEVILFYDHGIHPVRKNQSTPQVQSADLVQPVSPKNLKHMTCNGHRTILQIVAHEDDDLLFMNPDLLHSIQQGDCVRTIYITAGDAGGGKFYWLGREQGSEAAYETLAHMSSLWVEQTVKFAGQEFATVASPTKFDRLSLIFMHLPDGNPSGQGFAASKFESLTKLEAGSIAHIRSVDHQSSYDYKSLSAAIKTLIDVYQPSEVRTQLPYSADMTYVDHSDHTAVGRLVTEAYRSYQNTHPDSTMAYYIGYPIHSYEPNVGELDLSLKERAFFAYSHFDGAACASPELCDKTGVYDTYLTRQYRVDATSAQ